jgi:site-specific DNA-methyltransferase (adenine-specific)
MAGHKLELRLNIDDVVINDRIRKDLGNIDELTNSIREFGLIQPLVLYQPKPMEVPTKAEGLPYNENGKPELCAGGRRLTALKRLGIKELIHGQHYIWRDEEDAYRRKATELEENLRRQELSWQETVNAKAELLQLMQAIHGVATSGGRTRAELVGGESSGFGVRKLASMLGESVGQTSKDLQIANAIRALPQLRGADTKESAFRQLNILGAVATMAKAAAVHKVNNPGAQAWTLYEGDFRDHVKKVPNETVDLVYSDLPFGVDLSKMSKHSGGVVDYTDTRDTVVSCIEAIANESFRTLRTDRYAIFWFGFNYYSDLVAGLERAGFGVVPVPIVWTKGTRSTENPNTRYADGYDAALLAIKGSPVFMRPGKTNVVNIPAITSTDRLQIAQQPVALVKNFIEDTTAEGATVVDFTAGSGTTGVAALELKRRVILFEKEPQACTLIKARLGALR